MYYCALFMAHTKGGRPDAFEPEEPTVAKSGRKHEPQSKDHNVSTSALLS